jgi:hypothetical protein
MLDELSDLLGIWRPVAAVLSAWGLLAFAILAGIAARRCASPLFLASVCLPWNLAIGWALVTRIGPDLSYGRFACCAGGEVLVRLLAWSAAMTLGLANMMFPIMVTTSVLRARRLVLQRVRPPTPLWIS